MDNLLMKQSIPVTCDVVTRYEECAINGEYSLPEYCPDVTTMLKCTIQPRMLNRQQSGEQLLIDGEACVRVLYLDEERKGLRCVEFVLPFSCGIRGAQSMGASMPLLHLSTKYANCRVITPRRLEVRGAVIVEMQGDEMAVCDVVMPSESKELFCKNQCACYTGVVGSVERVMSINEALVFPDNLPPAEMLLGGECRSIVRECKLLNGKAIVKGDLYIHQLYTNDVKSGNIYHLDYVLPFSQILDLDSLNEGHRYTAQVMLLSDTERCGIGPDGSVNVLEFSAKLLVRLLAYQSEMTTLVLDAYHAHYPMENKHENLHFCEHKSMTFEQTMLPFKLDLPERNVTEIVDVWVTPQAIHSHCDGGLAHILGRLLVSVLYRDADRCICFYEQAEEFHLEYPYDCEKVMADVCVTDLRYRLIENCLELQVGIWLSMQGLKVNSCCAITDAKVCVETPYDEGRATAIVYYADAGETLWDVGKCCHASPERMCRENNIVGEVLETPSVLIVPVV